MCTDWKSIAGIRKDVRTGFSNGGWTYDAYPGLEKLDAHASISIARIQGPAVITCIHTTQHFGGLPPGSAGKAKAARGIVFEVYYNDDAEPAVRVPLGDFFADGCGGLARHFSSVCVEKAPESYNCFIPMPFEKSARVVLRNDTDHNFANYSFVEYERLPAWDSAMGYFHAAWSRTAFVLDKETDRPFFHVDGAGHLLGRSWSVCTAEPLFHKFHFIMEGNNEIRIDGEKAPSIDYLGTEDSFGFSWGFQKEFCGLFNGMNFILTDDISNTQMLSIYRFMPGGPIRFTKSLDLRVNWTMEKHIFTERFLKEMEEARRRGGGWVDYATTYYWYQETPGYAHAPLPPLEERCRPVLK